MFTEAQTLTFVSGDVYEIALFIIIAWCFYFCSSFQWPRTTPDCKPKAYILLVSVLLNKYIHIIYICRGKTFLLPWSRTLKF